MAVAVAFAVAQAPRGNGDPRLSHEERPAPPFALPDLADADRLIALGDVEGPAVLNIWASWCVPCRREMPVLQAAYSRYGDRVAFLGVDSIDQRNEALDFLVEVGVTYPSAYDPSGTVAVDYGVVGLPTTYFITGSKQIIATKLGELQPDELDEQIERLLTNG